MVSIVNDQQDENGIVLTEAQKKARRMRSIAIAGLVSALWLSLFYIVTLVEGPGVL